MWVKGEPLDGGSDPQRMKGNNNAKIFYFLMIFVLLLIGFL